MKATTPHPFITLPRGDSNQFDNLVQFLHDIHRIDFDCETYIRAKVHMLSHYMSRAGLKAAVIGISGGIDSAVCFEILKRVRLQDGTPIKIIPVFSADKHTDNSTSIDYVNRVMKTDGDKYLILRTEVNVPVKVENLQRMLDLTDVSNFNSDWVIGQRISYTRQSDLYSISSMATEMGFPTIVIGTINRTEGSYLGYVCKAGDNMTDVQLISDIHKSQVVSLAKHMGIDPKVVSRDPVGDLFDARTDEQLFGTDYPTIEFFHHLIEHEWQGVFTASAVDSLSDKARQELTHASENVDYIHNLNAHKYLVGSPAVHLDLFPVHIMGGRDNSREPTGKHFELRNSSMLRLPTNNSIGTVLFDINRSTVPNSNYSNGRVITTIDVDSTRINNDDSVIPITLIKNAVSSADLNLLHQGLLNPFEHELYTDSDISCGLFLNPGVSLTAYETNVDEYGSDVTSDSIVHASRVRFNSLSLAFWLNSVIAGPAVPKLIHRDGNWYRYIGVNPYFRFLKYEGGDKLLMPHLDGNPEAHSLTGDTAIGLLTMQLYLNDCPDSGTQFVDDRDAKMNSQGDYTSVITNPANIIANVQAEAGTIAIFDGANIYHQSAPTGNENSIKHTLLTELMYVKIPVPGTLQPNIEIKTFL